LLTKILSQKLVTKSEEKILDVLDNEGVFAFMEDQELALDAKNLIEGELPLIISDIVNSLLGYKGDDSS